jgi:hypothetical protein
VRNGTAVVELTLECTMRCANETRRNVPARVLCSVRSVGDAWLRIGGRVSGPRGPLAGASVEVYVNGTLADDRATAITDANGEYQLFLGSCPCDFEFELRVAKPGYELYVLKLRGRAANEPCQHDIVLLPLRSAG